MTEHLNVFVDDDTGATYRVCFVAPNLPKPLERVSVVRQLHDRQEARPIDASGAKGRQMVQKARAMLSEVNVYQWSKVGDCADLIWSGLALNDRTAIVHARKVMKLDGPLFSRYAHDDPYRHDPRRA